MARLDHAVFRSVTSTRRPRKLSKACSSATMSTAGWGAGFRFKLKPWMALLHEPAKPSQVAVCACSQHRCVMHHIAANHLRHADAVITGFDQIAPEVEVFPATRNVGVTANPLPGRAPDQCHGIDVISLQEFVPLPQGQSMQASPLVCLVVLLSLDGNPGVARRRILLMSQGPASGSCSGRLVAEGCQHQARSTIRNRHAEKL